MKEVFLKAKVIKEACDKHKYLKLRMGDNKCIAINTKVCKIAISEGSYDPKATTRFIGYSECSFHEYLTYKIPLVIIKEK